MSGKYGYVYMLKGLMGSRKWHYIGSTLRDNPFDRINEHINKQSKYTSKMTHLEPILLVQCAKENARSVEWYFKRFRDAPDQLAKGNLEAKAVENFYKWCAKVSAIIYEIKWGEQIVEK